MMKTLVLGVVAVAAAARAFEAFAVNNFCADGATVSPFANSPTTVASSSAIIFGGQDDASTSALLIHRNAFGSSGTVSIKELAFTVSVPSAQTRARYGLQFLVLSSVAANNANATLDNGADFVSYAYDQFSLYVNDGDVVSFALPTPFELDIDAGRNLLVRFTLVERSRAEAAVSIEAFVDTAAATGGSYALGYTENYSLNGQTTTHAAGESVIMSFCVASTLDCAGVMDGSAAYDACGVCNGDG
eukprot:CAMPEP_0198314946 /NCGR_PEP_ID=MMETSP1450-20131203/5396_1 /TAXON_ID=753684 ORGANISM="Madagascaria erythrocladiodes, Strain CCMP3234" /NCGR_SAMPLE_ID=MMETSP1450 /ASSEMBLY_ACC=CAM_ASM_001115 /LENGTH=244 /DNA_ID=CAMNT_0044018031 /DNA_START=119 /DNA_END=850 /DNA_ORIENTATION=+